MQVVPASVLIATVAAAARESGAAGVGDVRFQYPVVADRPRVVRVRIGTDGTVTVASTTSPNAAADRWVTHVTATTIDTPVDLTPGALTDPAPSGFDAAQAEGLQERWGIDGRPYPWSVGDHSATPGTLTAEVGTTSLDSAGQSAIAFVDAAIHLARLLDSSHDGLMFPSSVDSVALDVESAASAGHVELRHRAGDADGFSTDVVVSAPDTAEALVPAVDAPVWAELTEDETRAQLRDRLRAILAREIGMPTDALRIDQPFPELGLDSMMAMTVLRDARQLVGMDLSATMLWNHPTVEAMSDLLTDLLEPARRSAATEPEPDDSDVDSVLDSLFDSVESLSDDPLAGAESVSASSESGDA
ncbi:beta-ketoacyl synthase [Mycobacteroides abscessus subsp. abscessus]|nr:beta-ketoacyl synthase [Mycobacteroides abscessus subsp. abscessus]